MDKYLIKYLRDHTDSPVLKKYIDFFKVELDWHIYNGDVNISKRYYRNNKPSIKFRLYTLLQFSVALFFKKVQDQNKLNILSTAYFFKELSVQGFNAYTPIWHPLGRDSINMFGDLKTINWDARIRKAIRYKDFNAFLDSKFVESLESFQDYFIDQYRKKDFRALLLNTDQYFYSKYFIDIFKKLNKPSIVFSHGLPGVYSTDVDNRSDYLMVWGEKIRQNYINAGFDPSKIKVSGSPKFRNVLKHQNLRSSLDNVLVVPNSIAWHQNEYDHKVVIDKSSTILYLYKVQNVLKSLGVKQSRYRVHPSINKQWVHKFLDSDFYIQDNEGLNASLKQSSLVVGSTSTVMLEALIAGVNYILFEPIENNINMAGCRPAPPFDGSERKLMLCRTENDLKSMLKFNALTDYSLVHDYIQKFDISILKDIIR